MENDIVINAKNLSKCYQIYNSPIDRIKQTLLLGKKNFYKEFWALQDLNFQIRKGESVGIIGRNGCGKSTLLQLLCSILSPTTGVIKVHGRIAALLELGAGFNPEFTGYENIYLNSFLLGSNRAQVDALMDKILDFAEIGEFINQPVKTYSSGMFVRLAFAVQVSADPEILIIDEALSVGDVFFQQKCAVRMQQLRTQGTTLIFVSHDMTTVRDLCDTALYLKAGKLMYAGRSSEAIWKYYSEQQAIPSLPENNSNMPLPLNSSQSTINFISEFKKTAYWINPEENSQFQNISRLIAIAVSDIHNNSTTTVEMTGLLKFKILYQVFTTQPVPVRIAFRNRHNHLIHESGSTSNAITPPNLQPGEYAIFEFDMQCMIEAGIYTFSVGLDNVESPKFGPIIITWDYVNKQTPWHGMFGIPSETRILPVTCN